MKVEIGKLKATLLGQARMVRNELDRRLALEVMNHASNLVSSNTKGSGRGGAAADPDVILPAAAGSYGDEGLAHGSYQGLCSAGRVPVLWSPDSEDGSLTGEGYSLDLASLDRHRIGITSLMQRQAKNHWAGRSVYVIGADTVGGDYLHGFLGYRVRALTISANAERDARLVNFSFGKNPTPTAVRLLRSLPEEVELWARDVDSQSRASTVLGRQVYAAPDVAALMAPLETVRGVEFVARMEGPYVVLVPNAHFMTMGWRDSEVVVEDWVEVALGLIESGYQIALVPHDVRERPGDVQLAGEIQVRLNHKGVRSSVYVPKSAPDAKYVISHASGVVSARMHGCVAALSMAVPTVGIEYLDKFRGQFEWYKGLGVVVDMDRVDRAVPLLTELQELQESGASAPHKRIGWRDYGWLTVKDESGSHGIKV